MLRVVCVFVFEVQDRSKHFTVQKIEMQHAQSVSELYLPHATIICFDLSSKSCSKEERDRMSLLLPRHGASVSSLLELPPALPSLAHRPGPLLIKASCLSSSEQQNERHTYSVQVHGSSKDFTQQVEKDTEIAAIFRDIMRQRACFIRQSRAICVLSCCKRRHAFH